MVENTIFSDSHGLERGYDAVPHINIPKSVCFVFLVYSKHKIKNVQKKSHLKYTHE